MNDMRSTPVTDGAVITDTEQLVAFIAAHGKNTQQNALCELLLTAAYPDDVSTTLHCDPYLSQAAFGKDWAHIIPRHEGHDVWTLRGTA